jgi:multiple sugar transport system substrate-binding protein
MTRRGLLAAAIGTAGAALLAACGQTPPTVVPTKPTEAAKPAAGIAPAPTTAAAAQATAPAAAKPAAAKGVTVKFVTGAYGDETTQRGVLDPIFAAYKSQSGNTVDYEIFAFPKLRDYWRLAASCGEAPDAGDQFQMHSHVQIGGGKCGPAPMDDYKSLFGNLEQRFTKSSLPDVMWQGKWYGIPHRVDIRPQVYRPDYFQEVGLSKPPDTWDDLIEFGKKLTKADGSRWGVGIPSAGMLVQYSFTWIWQAGGAFMDPEGKKATVNTPEVKAGLKMLHDLVQVHKAATPNVLDPSFNLPAEFKAGKVAMIPTVSQGFKFDMEKTAPQLAGKWVAAIGPQGPKTRDHYLGAGYYGMLQNSKVRDQTAEFLAFFTSDDNLLKTAKAYLQMSPSLKALQDPYFANDPWYKVSTEALQFGRTSQHPSAAWAKLVLEQPGGVIFDMVTNTISGKVPIDQAVATAQEAMQKEMDALAQGR